MARILIVDDEPDVRELFNITLKMAGHVTDTAKHGLEAVDKLKTMPEMPELIVLDLMMPHLDGFGLLSHIRAEMPSKPFRVLIATAKVLEEADQEKLSTWPVVGVLNKGELDIGQMVVIVSNALGKSPLKDGSDKTTGTPKPEPPADKAASAAKPEAPSVQSTPKTEDASEKGKPPAKDEVPGGKAQSTAKSESSNEKATVKDGSASEKKSP